MARSGRSEPKKVESKPLPVVGNKGLAQRLVTYTKSEIPIRTLIFMEVGDVPPDQVRQAVSQVRALHGESLHPTFVLPVRDRKLTGDVIFEQELLDMIRSICTVDAGQIVLCGGVRQVDIMRAQL